MRYGASQSGSLEPEFTGDEGLTDYHVSPKDSSKNHREKILEVKVTGSAAESTMTVNATPLSLDEQGSILDRLISEHEGKDEEKKILENVRLTLLHSRIVKKYQQTTVDVAYQAYLTEGLSAIVFRHVSSAVTQAKSKSGDTLQFHPSERLRLIYAIGHILPPDLEGIDDLDMNALLSSAQEEVAPDKATASTPAIDAVPL